MPMKNAAVVALTLAIGASGTVAQQYAGTHARELAYYTQSDSGFDEYEHYLLTVLHTPADEALFMQSHFSAGKYNAPMQYVYEDGRVEGWGTHSVLFESTTQRDEELGLGAFSYNIHAGIYAGQTDYLQALPISVNDIRPEFSQETISSLVGLNGNESIPMSVSVRGHQELAGMTAELIFSVSIPNQFSSNRPGSPILYEPFLGYIEFDLGTGGTIELDIDTSFFAPDTEYGLTAGVIVKREGASSIDANATWRHTASAYTETFFTIPAPSAAGLLMIGSVAAARRRRG